MLRRLALSLMVAAGGAMADETVPICHGYGCLTQADILYSEGQLGEIRRLLFSAHDAAEERARLSLAIGRLYAWGGEQSEIANDRGGNYADEGRPGKMDCIDHATSTTRLLRLLESRGYLNWHRVDEPQVRYFAAVFPAHWAAVIATTDCDEAERFVVDSWFVNNGEPAVILPLEEWKKGAGPDV